MQFSISIKGLYIHSQTFTAFVGLFIQIRPSKNEFSMYIPGENVHVFCFLLLWITCQEKRMMACQEN